MKATEEQLEVLYEFTATCCQREKIANVFGVSKSIIDDAIDKTDFKWRSYNILCDEEETENFSDKIRELCEELANVILASKEEKAKIVVVSNIVDEESFVFHFVESMPAMFDASFRTIDKEPCIMVKKGLENNALLWLKRNGLRCVIE